MRNYVCSKMTRRGGVTAPRAALLVLMLVVGGCGDSTVTPSDGGTDAGGDADQPNCPAAMTDLSALAGTTHSVSDAITEDTVWTAADSPHIVSGGGSLLQIQGATLTIESCAVVLFDPDSGLRMTSGGRLVVAGTSDGPVRLDRNASEPWKHILVDEDGWAELHYASIRGGGADMVTYDGATLVAEGPTDRPYVYNLLVDNVLVEGSQGVGVLMRRHAGFVDGSAGLIVTGAGAAGQAAEMMLQPVWIDIEAAGSLPDGDYVGNASDEIGLHVFPGVRNDTVLRNLGVPYRVGTPGSEPARITGARLTVEAGVELHFSAGRGMWIDGGGSLVVAGTSAALVTFRRADDEPWGYILVDEDGWAELHYVSMRGGGADMVTYDGATLVAEGPTDRPYVYNLLVDNVLVEGSQGIGVLMRRHTGFAEGSTGLTVTGSGAAGDADTGLVPLVIDAQAAGTLPMGEYTGNGRDVIVLEPFTEIQQDAVFHDRGVPYLVGMYPADVVRVAAETETAPMPTLTIEAGVTVLFHNAGFTYTSIRVGSGRTRPGSLVIAGTGDQPVVLSSGEDTPAAGDWIGIVFSPAAAQGIHSIEYAMIEYAGHDWSGGGYICAAVDSDSQPLPEDAAVVIHGWAPTASFLRNSVIAHSAGWGVLRGWDAGMGGDVDFTATNDFSDLRACAQNQLMPANRNCNGDVVYSCAPTP